MLQQTPQLKVVPGNKLYSQSHVKTTLIISDSTPKRIHNSEIKANIDLTKEDVVFKRYPGQTAEEIAYYAPKPLRDINPEVVIIIAGTNDLTKGMFNGGVVDEYEVVKNIKNIGCAARDSGAKKIYISGILVRKGYQYKNVTPRVNNLLQSMCSDENFVYIDQSDITTGHISGDGIHPNFYGTTVLKYNILSIFPTFNPYLSDFDDDYERSLF